ncbi:phospholipase D-like domain-containing protein [Dactylosporangium sp. NPDC049742]|uniref:phospholipase D family protein n=1 Tax=Dactylosporangium sp. NPDC049742 TaxID=3154737 RepID=UPI00341C40A2
MKSDWFLTEEERGNPHTRITAWTDGNAVRPLIDGKAYFAELYTAIERMERGDLLLFTDWRGDVSQRVTRNGPSIGDVLCDAARRGVRVKGLIWRSHWNALQFSAAENRRFARKIEAAGGECLRDMRVLVGGSHHQKLVVLRHPGRPELDRAYVGGIDLCHGRRDTQSHEGDPQAVEITPKYGKRPPWHDVQLELRGPVVGQVEATFRERWEDPSALSRNPLHWLQGKVEDENLDPDRLPPQLPDPPPAGPLSVQLLRTYPYRRGGYPFAPEGEFSVARGYGKAVRRARRLIYLEDQYLWSPKVASCFADALREHPELHLIAVVPRHPDRPDKLGSMPQLYGRERALAMLREAGGDRLHVFSPENAAGTPIYVHAKVCVVDDTWATTGSDNVSLRSWTHDSELTCAVLDPAGSYARDLRERLCREHLELDELPEGPIEEVFDASAKALQAWHDSGRIGPRPPGRLLPYRPPTVPRRTATWARVVYNTIHDPDGRPRQLRRDGAF